MLSELTERYGSPPKVKSREEESYTSRQRPHSVSEVKSLSDHIEQYKGNPRLQASLRDKLHEYPYFREIRGDGNCFYRAFICGFLEMSLHRPTAGYYLRLLFEFLRIRRDFVTDCSQPEMMNFSDYYHFLMHRLLQLFTYRVELAESTESLPAQN